MDNKLDHKACAESYEKKLADSYESFEGIKNILHDTQKQLSEANARNARLAALLQAVTTDIDKVRGSVMSCGHGWPCGCSKSDALKELHKPSTLAQQVKHAQNVVADWPKGKAGTVKLEGSL